jgi:hypothetical protein
MNQDEKNWILLTAEGFKRSRMEATVKKDTANDALSGSV